MARGRRGRIVRPEDDLSGQQVMREHPQHAERMRELAEHALADPAADDELRYAARRTLRLIAAARGEPPPRRRGRRPEGE